MAAVFGNRRLTPGFGLYRLATRRYARLPGVRWCYRLAVLPNKSPARWFCSYTGIRHKCVYPDGLSGGLRTARGYQPHAPLTVDAARRRLVNRVSFADNLGSHPHPDLVAYLVLIGHVVVIHIARCADDAQFSKLLIGDKLAPSAHSALLKHPVDCVCCLDDPSVFADRYCHFRSP